MVDTLVISPLFAGSDGLRVLWSHTTRDLNVNVIALRPGEEIGEHVNSAVDVLLVALQGEGIVSIEGQTETIHAGQALIIPKGMSRSICCEAADFVYLTCHIKRPGLQPQPPASSNLTSRK
jgi:quercetin dioxygenase-like cupin family protein